MPCRNGVNVTCVEEAVQAVRVGLVDAAQAHGVGLAKLVWASAWPGHRSAPEIGPA